jgi:hypothetical protein
MDRPLQHSSDGKSLGVVSRVVDGDVDVVARVVSGAAVVVGRVVVVVAARVPAVV